jgi:hypothetical protein
LGIARSAMQLSVPSAFAHFHFLNRRSCQKVAKRLGRPAEYPQQDPTKVEAIKRQRLGIPFPEFSCELLESGPAITRPYG